MDQYLKGTTTWGPSLQDAYVKVSYDEAADMTYADQKIQRVTKVVCGLLHAEDGDAVEKVVAWLKSNKFSECSPEEYDALACDVYREF